MASLNDIRDAYIEDGINYANASARAAQDAILDLISKSTLSRVCSITNRFSSPLQTPIFYQ